MTDDLRTRIVTALWESWEPTAPSIEDMADAVIAELGMREDRVGNLTRWVTGWTEGER